MRIDRLELRNYRRFTELDLDLHPQMTVLVGPNGSGKTAVLEALACLAAQLGGLPADAGLQMHDGDIRVRAVHGQYQTAVEPVLPCRISCRTHSGKRVLMAFEHHPLKLKTSVSAAISERDLPILRFVGADTGAKPTVHMDASRRAAYALALTGHQDRVKLSHWFLRREDIRLQAVSDALDRGDDHPGSITDPLLEAMNDVLRAVIGVDRVMFRKKEGYLLARFDGEPWLRFDRQALGRRRLINLVADLAWMSFALNPHLDASAPKRTPGVVLIDEVDLHLHPEWQREILDKLCAAFPRVQFVVTTHSPQVVAGARPEWLRILDGDSVRGVEHTYGRDSSSLLQDVFGVPTYPSSVMARYYEGLEAIENGDLAGARDLALALEQQLGPVDTLVQGLHFEIQAALPVASDD